MLQRYFNPQTLKTYGGECSRLEVIAKCKKRQSLVGQKPQINPWMHCVYTSDHFEPEPDSRDWVNWLERRLRWSRPRLHRSGRRVCSVALKRCPGKSSQRSTLIAQVAKVNWNIWSIVVRPVIIQALQRQQFSKKNNKKLPLHHQKSVEALVVMWTPSRHKWPTPSRKYHIKFLPLLCPTIKITCMIKKTLSAGVSTD